MGARARTTLSALLSLALASGCTASGPRPGPSDEPSPVVSTAPPTSPSPTPTPTPTHASAPAPPPELSRPDETGAAAAATYFVSLYSYMMQTGDTDVWGAMSAEPCVSCKRLREDAAARRDNGESYSGGEITLSNVVVGPLDDLIGGYPVDANFTQTPVLRTARDGTVLIKTDGDAGVVQIDTIYIGDSWQILALVVKDA